MQSVLRTLQVSLVKRKQVIKYPLPCEGCNASPASSKNEINCCPRAVPNTVVWKTHKHQKFQSAELSMFPI